MVGFREYACIVDNLVGQILHLLMKVINTDDCQIIIYADINLTTMSIGKARYPFQILVLPNALVLYVLIFLIHIAKLAKKTEVHNGKPKIMLASKDGRFVFLRHLISVF